MAEQMKAYGYEWHQVMVGRIEAAQRPLRLNEAVDLAALFGIPLEMLLMSAEPEIDEETLRARIAETRQRLEMAAGKHAELQALWDAGTAELARLGPRHIHARQVMEKEQGKLEMLLRLQKQAERDHAEDPSA